MNNLAKMIILILLLCFSCSWGYAQKTKKVSGSHTYVLEENETPAEGREKALQRARKDAIEKEYGTSVSQRNFSQMIVNNGESLANFASVGQSLVRGIWIRDTEEPKYLLGVDQNKFYIKCSVRGYAREYKTAPIGFEAKLLRNGKTLQSESKDGVFKDGDKLYLLFQSPADGYIAVYLVDANKKATCLLPDAFDTDGRERVVHGVQKVYFAPDDRNDYISYGEVDGMTLNCEDKLELNNLYIIFSPNPFTKANDRKDNNGLRSLPQESFLEWLERNLNIDSQMSVDNRVIEIEK